MSPKNAVKKKKKRTERGEGMLIKRRGGEGNSSLFRCHIRRGSFTKTNYQGVSNQTAEH